MRNFAVYSSKRFEVYVSYAKLSTLSFKMWRSWFVAVQMRDDNIVIVPHLNGEGGMN